MSVRELDRVEIAASDDFVGRDRLEEVLGRLGYLGNTDAMDVTLGRGLSVFHRGETEVSVFVDAWMVDLVGPPEAVQEIVATWAGRDYD